MKNNTHFSTELCGINIKVFRTGESMRLDKNNPGSAKDVHSHFTYEIFFVGEDSLEIVSENKRAVYERKAVIIPPKLKHYTVSGGKDCFCLLFSVSTKDAAATAFPHDSICVLNVTQECLEYIRRAAQMSETDGKKAQKDAELFINLAFNQVMDMLSFYKNEKESTKSNIRHIHVIEQYINVNIFEKITLKDISQHIFLSTRQISRIISAEYGCGFCQLITDKKLDAAEMLIKNTDMKISAIAAQINIGSDNYFYHVFKKKYGMSPLKYRKKNRIS